MSPEVREKPVNFNRLGGHPPGDEVGDMESGLRNCRQILVLTRPNIRIILLHTNLTFNDRFCAILFSVSFGIVRRYMALQHSTAQIHSHIPPPLLTPCFPPAVSHMAVYRVTPSDTARYTGNMIYRVIRSDTAQCT